MSYIQAWIHASRLRTLPLAVSGVFLGSLIAYAENAFRCEIFCIALITTLLLQILSNWANDYGDFSHGVDNNKRIGPKRSLQSGAITPKIMKKAIIGLSIITFLGGILLLMLAFENIISLKFIVFLIIGILAIAASIKYTIGSGNYGYKGFGDIMVFLFFGLAAVLGTYFLHSTSLNPFVILPAASIGLLSSGVLNINNMRDVENDKASGKITLAVKLGKINSKIYHFILIILAVGFQVLFLVLSGKNYGAISLIIPSILLFAHCRNVVLAEEPKNLDPELKKLSLSTLLISIWVGIALIL